jgi:hypothetical protein
VLYTSVGVGVRSDLLLLSLFLIKLRKHGDATLIGQFLCRLALSDSSNMITSHLLFKSLICEFLVLRKKSEILQGTSLVSFAGVVFFGSIGGHNPKRIKSGDHEEKNND